MIQPLSQRDKRWKDIKLGTSDTTIGNFGCTITCIAMIVGTTPDVVNERMKQVGGFSQGNLVIWAKIDEAFPGIKTRRVWMYDNDDVKANIKHVLVEVDGKPIGGFRHWVVYVGGTKCYDPWDGQEDPTSDYPNPVSYCVLEGTWEKGVMVGGDMVSVESKTFENLVRKSTIYDRVRAKINVEDSETVVVAEVEKLIGYEDKVIEKDRQIATLIEEMNTLKEQFKKQSESLQEATDQVIVLTDKVGEAQKTITRLTLQNEASQEALQSLQDQTKLQPMTGIKKLIFDVFFKGR